MEMYLGPGRLENNKLMTNSSYRSRFLFHFLVPVIATAALLALLLSLWAGRLFWRSRPGA